MGLRGRIAVVIVAVAWVAIVPPGADAVTKRHVGAYTVKWPALRNLEAGDTLRVSLKRPARRARTRAVVSLLRVARSGRPLKLIERRRVSRRGVFSARLLERPIARYELRVRSGRHRVARAFTVEAPAPAPAPPPQITPPAGEPCTGEPDEGTLTVAPVEAAPGQAISVSLLNTGQECLQTSWFLSWEVLSDGGWTEIPLQRPWPLSINLVAPAASFSQRFTIPADTTPGDYRVGKLIDLGGSPTKLVAAVRVTA